MLCPTCMQHIQKEAAFCPYCGRPLNSNRQAASHGAYLRPDYDPCRDGYFPRKRTGEGQEKRPPLTGTVLVALLNMLGFGFGISLSLGLAALIVAFVAASEDQAQEALKKLEWAKRLNLIGLVFLLLQLFFLVALASWFVLIRKTTGGLDFPLG